MIAVQKSFFVFAEFLETAFCSLEFFRGTPGVLCRSYIFGSFSLRCIIFCKFSIDFSRISICLFKSVVYVYKTIPSFDTIILFFKPYSLIFFSYVLYIIMYFVNLNILFSNLTTHQINAKQAVINPIKINALNIQFF